MEGWRSRMGERRFQMGENPQSGSFPIRAHRRPFVAVFHSFHVGSGNLRNWTWQLATDAHGLETLSCFFRILLAGASLTRFMTEYGHLRGFRDLLQKNPILLRFFLTVCSSTAILALRPSKEKP